MQTVVKLILSLLALGIAFLPSWLFLAVKHTLSPQGFWQNLVIFGLGAYFLWGLQVMLFVLWIMVMFAAWKRR